jgi:4-aminobutyrate aminotransferase/(S)-3-amino-2-methylpropionate transaminase
VAPDLITTAKSLAAGLPLAAVTGRAELLNAPHVGGLGGTYGGNPVACRAALAVLDILQNDGLLKRGQELGEKLGKKLLKLQDEFEIIGEVRGKGAMLGMELVKDREKKTPATEETKKLISWCHENGLILLACGNFGNVLRTLMPLTISDEDLDRGLNILRDGLLHITKNSA